MQVNLDENNEDTLRELNYIRSQLAQKNVQLIKIKSSLSYRLGFALSKPFRYLYDMLRSGRNEEGTQYLDPTARKSIAPESNDYLDVLLTKHVNYEEIRINYHIDYCIHFLNSVVVGGWVLGQDQDSAIVVKLYARNKMIAESLRNLNRKDVFQSLGVESDDLKAGFHIEVEDIGMDNEHLNEVEIEFVLYGKVLKRVSSELTTNYTRLSYNQQYEVYRKNHLLAPAEFDQIKRTLDTFEYNPLISIIVPVYNTDHILLDECIRSVLNQWYTNWELCIYSDGSTSEETINKLNEIDAFNDPRIKIQLGNKNGHISFASNEAIKQANGDYIGLLDHDDLLTVNALYEMVHYMNESQDDLPDMIYSDEDKIDENGERLSDPYFKSDFNPDLLLSNNYICHFTVIKKEVGDKVGWFREGLEGAQDHDLFLRISAVTKKIAHIPKILYHWRISETSTAGSLGNKDYATKASIRALIDYCKNQKIEAKVENGLTQGSFYVRRKIIDNFKVTIIIPFKDHVELLKTCIKSILEKTNYKNYELVLVSNNSADPETFEYIEEMVRKHEHISFIEYNVPFNYSEINNWAAKNSKGEFLLFLNNDIEVISAGWLTAMVSQGQRKEVGAVGAKLLFDDDTVQHAGVIIGVGGVAGHAHKFFQDSHHGYFHRNNVVQNYSACTAACLLVKRDAFDEVGGFNEKDLKVAFNDIDLCMKICHLGYSIVFTPYAKLYHYESKSRGAEDSLEKQERFAKEVDYFKDTWKEFLEKGDPFYNVNLSLSTEKFDINLEL